MVCRYRCFQCLVIQTTSSNICVVPGARHCWSLSVYCVDWNSPEDATKTRCVSLLYICPLFCVPSSRDTPLPPSIFSSALFLWTSTESKDVPLQARHWMEPWWKSCCYYYLRQRLTWFWSARHWVVYLYTWSSSSPTCYLTRSSLLHEHNLLQMQLHSA